MAKEKKAATGPKTPPKGELIAPKGDKNASNDAKTVTERSGGRAILKLLVVTLVSIAATGFFFFLGAGRTDIPAAWYFLGTLFAATFGGFVVLGEVNPDLLVHRLGKREEAEGWDRKLLLAYLLVGARLQPFVCGLDVGRYQWWVLGPQSIIPGFLIFILSQVLLVWAMAANTHFEAFVRIQRERDHRVVDTGPYAHVRHPGYAASIPAHIGIALFLGSGAGLVAGGLALVILAIRTAREDAFLQENLKGYKEYTDRVRYRLVPGVW